jgi:NTP pyrophosphatase (non-canonical NTP hydrolase)
MGIEINKLAKQNHKLALEKGFWEDETIKVSCHIYDHTIEIESTEKKLLMVHGEISEAMEELRKDGDCKKIYFSKGRKPEGFGIELADAMLRIMDLAERRGINLEKCIRLKLKYNKTRPNKHGKRY